MLFKNKICSEQGSVLVESVLLLPVILLVFMAAAQFAHIFYARQIVEYASYSGARAGRLGSAETIQTNAYNSARQICSLIALTAPAGFAGENLTLPWLGEIAGSQNLDDKLTVTCTENPGESVTCTVQMDFPLVVPVVREFIAGVLRFSDLDADQMLTAGTQKPAFVVYHSGDGFPHLRFTRSAVVAKNFQVAD